MNGDPIGCAQLAQGINAHLCFACMNDHSIKSGKLFGRRSCEVTAIKLELDSKQSADEVVLRGEWMEYLVAHEALCQDMRLFSMQFLDAGKEE